jgi:general secretion pathway protein D
LLGAIPLVGNLFKSRSGSRQKSNLLVFLRPKILRDQAATEATSQTHYNDIRGDEKSLHKGHITLLPGEKQPSIPPIQPYSGPPVRTPGVGGTTVAPAPQPASTAQPAAAVGIATPPQAAPPTSQPAATTQPAPSRRPANAPQPATAPQQSSGP